MLAVADPDLDHGPRTERSATVRMCAVSREVRPIDELIRFVVAPKGDIVPDLKRKLPGRGLWVPASRGVVAEAVRRHHFSRGFKRDLRIPPTLPADTEALAGSQRDRCPWDCRQGGPDRCRFRQGRRRAVRAASRGPDPCHRRRRGRNPQIGHDRAAKWRDSRRIAGISDRQCSEIDGIGFGT